MSLKEFIMKRVETQKASIVNLKGGAAVEMIDRAIDKVIANIADINTDKGQREVVLKILIKPVDDNRMIIAFGISVPPPKLRGQEMIEGMAQIAVDTKNGIHAKEMEDRQMTFDNVTEIKGGK